MHSFSLPKRLAAAILLFASLGLSGCWEIVLKDPMVQGALSGDANAKSKLESFLKDPKNELAHRVAIEEAYREDFVYLPENSYASMTRDLDSYLKYVVGPLLARNDVSWEQAASYNLTDQTTFNYYKGFGAAYLDSLRSNPRNAWLKERLDMFKARAGKNYAAWMISWNEARKLLHDDSQFKLFLTDNNVAAGWLVMANSYSNNGFDANQQSAYNKLQNLGPIMSGFLPNASP